MTTAKRVKDAKIEKKFELARDKKREDAEVFLAPAQPLQDLRTAAGLSAQVRAMPPVLPRAGVARGDSRSFEVVVVGFRAEFVVREILRETKNVSLRMAS